MYIICLSRECAPAQKAHLYQNWKSFSKPQPPGFHMVWPAAGIEIQYLQSNTKRKGTKLIILCYFLQCAHRNVVFFLQSGVSSRLASRWLPGRKAEL